MATVPANEHFQRTILLVFVEGDKFNCKWHEKCIAPQGCNFPSSFQVRASLCQKKELWDYKTGEVALRTFYLFKGR